MSAATIWASPPSAPFTGADPPLDAPSKAQPSAANGAHVHPRSALAYGGQVREGPERGCRPLGARKCRMAARSRPTWGAMTTASVETAPRIDLERLNLD
jgi:hypothetical protein